MSSKPTLATKPTVALPSSALRIRVAVLDAEDSVDRIIKQVRERWASDGPNEYDERGRHEGDHHPAWDVALFVAVDVRPEESVNSAKFPDFHGGLFLWGWVARFGSDQCQGLQGWIYREDDRKGHDDEDDRHHHRNLGLPAGFEEVAPGRISRIACL